MIPAKINENNFKGYLRLLADIQTNKENKEAIYSFLVKLKSSKKFNHRIISEVFRDECNYNSYPKEYTLVDFEDINDEIIPGEWC